MATSILNSVADIPTRHPLTGGDRRHERSFGVFACTSTLTRTFHFEKKSLSEREWIRIMFISYQLISALMSNI